MKTLSYLFTLFFAFNALAAAPYGIKGQSQAGTLYSNVHQFPNNQVTNLGGINALVETGNKNILVNPSFEHSTFSTGWTNSAGTFTEETVLEIDGLKAAKLVLSAQTMSLTQSSTLYASQFADGGTQGLAMVRVKSDVALKVCAIQAGVVSTSLCVDVPAHNKWGLFKVPFILGATSNGISIASVGNVTGTVYIDDAFVGAVDLKADVPSVTTQTSKWASGSTGTGAVFTGTPTTSGSGNFTFSAGTITALRDINISMSCTGTSSGSFTIITGITAAGVAGPLDNTVVGVGNTASTSFTGILTNGQTAFCANTSGNTASSGYVSVTATNVINTSVYSSTNADTDWASCNFSTLAWSGWGTVTQDMRCKRQGSDLLMSGRVTTGTVTASQIQMLLPSWNGSQLSVAPSSKVGSLTEAGRMLRNSATVNNQKGLVVQMSPSNNYLTISSDDYALGYNPLTPLAGNVLTGSGEVYAFNARVPINGWENSNIIIGQFNGLESCTDSYQCTDTFSAKISAAGVVSGENIDWINGNASIASTSFYTLTFNTGIFTVTPNCMVTPGGASSFESRFSAESASAITAQFFINNGVSQASAFNIICQKQGADYIGKTAKAVASDQSVRSIGSVGMDIQSVYFGQGAGCSTACSVSPCVICNQVGSKITSVTRHGVGLYRLQGIDGFKYNCTATGNNATIGTVNHIRASSTTTYADFASSEDKANVSATCIGIP